MERYFPFTGTVAVPVQAVRLRFVEKEELSLDPFQNLILEAVEMGCGVGQIAEATLLEPRVIEAEAVRLLGQRLLERREGGFGLSDLSRRLLMVSRCVERMNAEGQRACVDLVSGTLTPWDDARFTKEPQGLPLRPRVRDQELDGISMGENLDFFRAQLRTLGELGEEETGAVLDSVYVEFAAGGERRFWNRPVDRLPCLISEETVEREPDRASAFWARGRMCQVTFSLKSALPGVEDGVLAQLPGLAEAGLLSEKGRQLAEAVAAFQGSGMQRGVYDYASGRFHMGAQAPKSGRQWADLELPVSEEFDEELREWFLRSAQEQFRLPPELELTAACTEGTYLVRGDLNEIWKEDDGDETAEICAALPGDAGGDGAGEPVLRAGAPGDGGDL